MTEKPAGRFQGPLPYVLWLTDSGGMRVPRAAAVRLPSFGPILALAGIYPEILAQWHQKYGFDSLGEGHNGELISPEFPVFGKLIDVIVDPVVLSPQECADLVIECAKLEQRGNDQAGVSILAALRDLASEASTRQLSLRIGG